MKKILLVDDVELFLALEKSYLDPSTYSTETAMSGTEALEKMEQFQPDLVLCDLFMPDINGDEVCRRLRQDNRFKDLPFIVVTSAGKQAEIDKCFAAGASDYITKPVNKIELLDKIKELLKAQAADVSEPKVATVEPVKSGTDDRATNGLKKENEQLLAKIESLENRVNELEEENLDFANQIVHIEGMNNNLTNLYVASSRLHSVLNRTKVASIIKEVVINFVGAEKFAVMLLDNKTDMLNFESGEGFEDVKFPSVRFGEGLLGEVAAGGGCYYRSGSVKEGSDDPLDPIAAIPLKIHGEPMGLLAIYHLLIQKEEFQQVDYQLFSMLAEHAATALFSATLYEASERKQKTYKSFMELLLQN